MCGLIEYRRRALAVLIHTCPLKRTVILLNHTQLKSTFPKYGDVLFLYSLYACPICFQIYVETQLSAAVFAKQHRLCCSHGEALLAAAVGALEEAVEVKCHPRQISDIL